MRALRTLTSAAVLAVSLTASPASATAHPTTTYAYHVWGTEVSATSTQGRFVGTASGSATGTWYAQVNHEQLHPNGDITPGGAFGMVLTKAAPAHTVTGRFSGGSIRQTDPGTNCTNQVYIVDGDLTNVTGTRTGTVLVTLTHHRKEALGKCWIYAATVDGTVTLP